VPLPPASGAERMPDLLVSTHTPVLRSGRAMRTYGLARALADGGGGLGLLYVRFGAPAPDESFRSIPGIELHEVVASRGASRLVAYLAARRRGVPHALARGVTPELAASTATLAARYGGRVIADGPTEAAALAGLAERLPVVYNAHNIESAFRGEFDTGGLGLRTLRAFERGVLRRSVESWVVSEADARAAQALCPGARVRVLPNVVDVARIAPVAAVPAARRAVFVGNFTYQPNVRALRFLLDEVMPRVWKGLPDARLRVVGTGGPPPPASYPRVEAVGFVEDIASAYAEVSCVVVPLLQGGGSPVKFVEAMAYGLPILATPRACAGLDVIDGEHCLVAEGGEAFATALSGLLRDGAPGLGERARLLAAERYSIEALTSLLAPGDAPSLPASAH
jgi:glycosyltransferase involved in cell wall biosynthesis